MNQTRVFVSSTCYDLTDLRETLHTKIIQLGHTPVMSEYAAFPVLPQVTTLDNCRRAVREATDIFILVLGGKRGSIDSESKKSIVEIEFDTAEESGIPSLVFVRRSVLDLLPLWQKNPSADFTPQADPDALAFVARIKEKSQWIFPFDRTGDIQNVLALRLSELLRHLLERHRSGRIDPCRGFNFETKRAEELARERPPYWEFLLTYELMRQKLAVVNKQLVEIENGGYYRPIKTLSKHEAFPWFSAKLSDLVNLGKAFTAAPNDLAAAWGPMGTPGDPVAIKAGVEKFVELCQHALDWEAEIIFTAVPEQFEGLKSAMRGTTRGIFREMARCVEELERPFRNNAKPTGVIEINLVFAEPETLPAINAEIQRVGKSIEMEPWQWA